MVNIIILPTSTWSTGFNGSIIIKNDSNNNYGSNWSISCVLPQNTNITWCDFMKITTNGNIITLSPQSYTNSLNTNITISGNFGGNGTIPTNFTFNSNGSSPAPVPAPTPNPIPTPTPTPNPSPTPTSGVNSQKRVVYLGYWITDSDVPRIVSELKNANVTHCLLTFITQPDNTQPLTGKNNMLDAFKSLSITNQKLLTNNFKFGCSLGGALSIPVPYSLTFCNSNCYYYNNPVKYAQDFYNLVKGTGLENYFDLDIEGINDKFEETAKFIGEVCKELKRLNPKFEISHAPQPPYFCQSFGNVYGLVYQNYNQYFDWFNIQYYNNGPANTFEQLFLKSSQNVTPSTSIFELINRGMKPSYLILGKTIQGESDSNNGYVPLSDMTNIIKQAFNTPSLTEWSKTGGEMVWYYNTQNSNTNNTQLLNYFGTISKL